jgi:hypothetical protein
MLALRFALIALVASAGAAAAEGREFIDDGKLLYRVAACGGPEVKGGGSTPTPGVDAVDASLAKVVDKHCKQINEKLAEFRGAYFEKHRSWFDSVVPKTVPKTVVYPFGGGDLISALVAFPDATEITTISLELAGDPRRLRTLTSKQLELSLGALRGDIGGLIAVGSNTTENLSAGQKNELPAQVSSFLLGLVAGGYEPVSMRYFKLDDAGSVVYLEQADIDAGDAADAARLKKQKEREKQELEAKKKAAAAAAAAGSASGSGSGSGTPVVEPPSTPKHNWQDPNFSLAFSNVEIQYRKVGEKDVRVHRHIGWNLGNAYLKTHPQLIRHLEKKGNVTILVKGASYLLWRGDFSKIRGYILDHLAWMLSDSTGVPPIYAKPAGMVQETYGAFTGAFLEGVRGEQHDLDFIEMWKKQKKRKLGFRFGYVDANKQAHVLVTRPRR